MERMREGRKVGGREGGKERVMDGKGCAVKKEGKEEGEKEGKERKGRNGEEGRKEGIKGNFKKLKKEVKKVEMNERRRIEGRKEESEV